jgi:FimV-like protein
MNPPAAATVAATPAAAPSALSKQEFVGAAALVGAALAALVAGLAMRQRRRAAGRALAERSSAEAAAAAAVAEAAPDAVMPRETAVARDDGAAHHVPETGRGVANEYDAAAEHKEATSLELPADEWAAAPVPHVSPEHPEPAPELPASPAQHSEPVESAEMSADEEATDTAAVAATNESQQDPAHASLPEAIAAEEAPDSHAQQPEPYADGLAGELPTPPHELPADIAASSQELTAATGQHPVEPSEHAVEEPLAASQAEDSDHPLAPPQFPRAALDALGSLDMSLPPRVEPDATTAVEQATQPVVAPEVTARQAVPTAQPEAPRVADEIEAGMVGAGAIAGMGAARYGPLALDFDLELPPSLAQPLSTFTPEELSRIARNKLELAAEYIELGDVSGARTLINEVIESNDAATRNDARTMLSTLAPLS